MSATRPPGNNWSSPAVVLAVLGMIGTAAGSYAAFDSRIARIEERGERIAEIDAKVTRILFEMAKDRR